MFESLTLLRTNSWILNFVLWLQFRLLLVHVGLSIFDKIKKQKEKKETANPEVYKQALLEITSRHQNYVQVFTYGSKVVEKVAAAVVSSVAPNSPFSCRLRDHCSIYTAEPQAVLFALKQAYQSQERKFMIFADSLSALQALGKLK